MSISSFHVSESLPLSPSDIVTRLRAAGCVFAEDEARLIISAAQTPEDLALMVGQRTTGVPLEHVLGWAEFCDLRIYVTPEVFVPRRRTELLVQQAVEAARARSTASPIVVDPCCGSGAVGAAVLAALDGVDLYSVDINPAAVACARRNLEAVAEHVYEGDLCAPLPASLRGRVDVIVANVPYVPTDAIEMMPPEARIHEPREALDGGTDGLDLVRRISEQAPSWLAPGGYLLVETSALQAQQMTETLAAQGFTTRIATNSDLDATVVIGTLPEG